MHRPPIAMRNLLICAFLELAMCVEQAHAIALNVPQNNGATAENTLRPAPTDLFPAVGSILSFNVLPGRNSSGEGTGNTYFGSAGTGFLSLARDPELTGHIVATAGHVLPGPFARWSRYDTDGTPLGTAAAGLRIVHPNYGKLLNGLPINDVGIVLLETPESQITPLFMALDIPDKGTEVSFVGTRSGGWSRDTGLPIVADATRRTRRGVGKFSDEYDENLVSGPRWITPDLHYAEPGDSGGPVMLGDSVIGINSAIAGIDSNGNPSFPPNLIAVPVDFNTGRAFYDFLSGNLIAARQSKGEKAGYFYDLSSPSPYWPEDRVLFSSVSTQNPELRDWELRFDSGKWSDQDVAPSFSPLGILNNDDLTIEYGFFDIGCTDDTCAIGEHPSVQAVLSVGDSGILNGFSGAFRIAGGGVTTSSFHNRGFLEVEPFKRRLNPNFENFLFDPTVLNPAWLQIKGTLLNEGIISNNAGQLVVTSSCVDVFEGGACPEGSGGAVEGVDFIQTETGALTITWDEAVYSVFAPFTVEGNISIAGTVDVWLPENLSIAEGLRLRLFEFGGDAIFSQAQVSFHQGTSIVTALLSADNGMLTAIAAPDSLPGDTDHDGVVGINDLNNVRNNFGAAGNLVLGDTNLDGEVDIIDLNNVRNNFGISASLSRAVPEPASIALVVWGLLFTFGCRRTSRPRNS